VRDATQPPPTSPQIIRAFEPLDIVPLVGSGWRKGDDYLNLNIWTPDPGAKGLPVMVYIHGGAFVGGCNYAPAQDGSAFARSGVVCASMNYRMGIEGFLPIPGVATNLGLRDMIAALEWVRDNAAAFGGDPGNVTVFGESAGAMAIGDLVTSPLARGLFKRAIIQSGHGGMVWPVAVAERVVRKLARMMRIAPDADGFRSRSIQDGVEAVAEVQLPKHAVDLREDGEEPAFGLSKFLPVYGDDVLPARPHDALKAGAGAEVQVLIGTNTEEMNLYLVSAGVLDKINGLVAWLMLRKLTRGAGALLKAYRKANRGKGAGYALLGALTDLVFRLPARRYAAAHQGRTHVYEFGWRSPALNGGLGACHALEIPFAFDTLSTCIGPKGIVGEHPPQALADRMHRIWVDFARDGVLPWPEYDARTRMVYRVDLDQTSSEAPFPAETVRR
jgi:para-nitrobenzyl esterase